MPEVHVPKLDEHDGDSAPSTLAARHPSGGKSLFKIALEVILISMGCS
jgi:hypothetical protein